MAAGRPDTAHPAHRVPSRVCGRQNLLDVYLGCTSSWVGQSAAGPQFCQCGVDRHRAYILVINRVDWSAQHIIALYWQRWPIETFSQDGKMHLGPDKYSMRNAEANGEHWCLAPPLFS
jgi:hypothetical protein